MASFAAYAQGPNSFGGVALRVNDTTTYQTNAAAFHTAGYYDIYFNNQATNDHWDVWNGSSYDHIFSFIINDASVSQKGIAQFNSNHFDDNGSGLISLDVAALTASETVSGFSEEATQSETDAGTATGGTGAKLFVTPEKLAGYNKLKAVYITGTVATTSASLGDVTGLQFPVTAGKHYRFRFVIPFSSSAATNGCQWAVNGPTLTTLNYHQIFPVSTSAMSYQPGLAAYNTSTASNNVATTGTNLLIMEGIITCSDSGNVIARFATEAGGTITVLGYASVDYLQLD